MKKIVIVNASPRKNWNTAMLLKEAEKGARESGAEVEYVDLVDLKYTGCRSCLACKRKDVERNKCYWKDDLSPLIEKIMNADSLIIGSPIYFGEATAFFRSFFERLSFCALSYDGGEMSYYKKKLNIGMVYTMNASKEYYDSGTRPLISVPESTLKMLFNGKVKVLPSYETYQVEDYSKFAMNGIDGADRKHKRETVFPNDMKKAYELGQELSK